MPLSSQVVGSSTLMLDDTQDHDFGVMKETKIRFHTELQKKPTCVLCNCFKFRAHVWEIERMPTF